MEGQYGDIHVVFSAQWFMLKKKMKCNWEDGEVAKRKVKRKNGEKFNTKNNNSKIKCTLYAKISCSTEHTQSLERQYPQQISCSISSRSLLHMSSTLSP